MKKDFRTLLLERYEGRYGFTLMKSITEEQGGDFDKFYKWTTDVLKSYRLPKTLKGFKTLTHKHIVNPLMQTAMLGMFDY